MDKNLSPLHLIPSDLSIGDKDLFQCAETHGTPCYVYDLKWVSKRWRELKVILPDGSKLCYSVKANPNYRIIETLNAIGSHFDAASIGEIRMLLKLGVNPQKIYYIAPGKLLKDIKEAILAGIKAIVVDSPGELTKVVEATKFLNWPQAIMFRLNPGKRSRGSLSMSGTTQFGMMKQEIINCWQTLLKNDKRNVICIGLHCFQGTNILDSRRIGEEFRRALVEFSDIGEQVGKTPQYVDVGGGFGSPIHTEEHSIDISDLRKELTSVFATYEKRFANSTYLFESGRYIVGGGGVFLTRVSDVKELYGIRYAILDGGINCYGGIWRTSAFRPPPIRVLSSNRPQSVVTLCGPLCTPFDILAHSVELPTVDIGDLVAIYHAGAYQYTASPGRFLSFGFPVEVCIG